MGSGQLRIHSHLHLQVHKAYMIVQVWVDWAGRIKSQVIRATFLCNLSPNIVALQFAKLCCPYYHSRKQLVTQQISVLQVAATCCNKLVARVVIWATKLCNL